MEDNLFDRVTNEGRPKIEVKKDIVLGDEEITDNMFDVLAGKKAEHQIDNQKFEDKKKLKSKISERLSNLIKDKQLFGTKDKREIAWVEKTISDIIADSGTDLPKTIQREIIQEMVLEITSYGRIHHLMLDKTITEVMINSHDEVWIEKRGDGLVLTDIKFSDDDEVMDLAIKIATFVGRSVNNTQPIVDARLPDGSRVHIVIPPISIKGTTITIRKFFEERLTIDDLIKFKTISPEAAQFLKDAVHARSNIIVSGGTGSGKTTTLNIISNFIPDGERVLTIEDSAELQLSSEHVVKMESRNANNEGKGEITIRDLVKASLRMRPERIIVGEVRDGTAFDLLQAMNTGHDGSMATTHANDPDACIKRIDNLTLMTGMNLAPEFIRQQIADAVDLIVQISRLSDGSRKITHISEVVAYDPTTKSVITKPIYLFKKTGIDENKKFIGVLEYTGHIVTNNLQNKFEMHGLNFFDSVGLPRPEEA